MPFAHLFLVVVVSVHLPSTTETPVPETLAPKVVIGSATLSGGQISFTSSGGTNTCTVDGNATLILGEVVHRADTIRFTTGPDSGWSLRCSGNVTVRNDDDTGDRMSGDLLVYDRSWKLTGNVVVEYGDHANQTKVTCDSATFGNGVGRYQFSGNVKLQHDQ